MAAHYEGSASKGSNGGAANYSVPVSVLDDDLMIMMVNGPSTLTITSPPSGWTDITPTYVSGNRTYFYWKQAASEPATYAMTTGGGAISNTTIAHWRAVDGTTPIDVTAATQSGGTSTTTISLSSITNPTAGDQVLFLAGTTGNPTYNTPTGFTNRLTGVYYLTLSNFIADQRQAASGVTGTKSTAMSVAGDYGGMLASLRERAGVAVNTVAPSISGTSAQGSTLTCTTGTWTGSPTDYVYQWTRAGRVVLTETVGTYTTGFADLGQAVGCKVSARNASGLAGSTSSSNTITVTPPVYPALGTLKYAPPAQHNPTTINLTSNPDNYFVTASVNTWTPGADYIITLSSTVPRTGLLEIDATGARSVKIIGGLWALDDSSSLGPFNYHIHIKNISGWIFIEGQEADMTNTHADFISAGGSPTGAATVYQPDVYIQNCRAINLNANNSTNHSDIIQPQARVGRMFVDKLTFSSNYDGYTVAADGSTGSVPMRLMRSTRVNCWYATQNVALPATQLFWINNANGNANKDTAPFPFTLDDVYCDLTRGYGRANFSGQIARACFPGIHETGAGCAAGGNLATGGPSPFTAGEFIGARDSGDLSYAYWTNPKMMVGGVLHSGSPPSRSDVGLDDDGANSFVVAGVGSGYATPGYQPAEQVGVGI